MSTFWHKMSDLKPVCSIKMWKLTEKSHFWALSVMFLRLVCILKLEGLLKAMLSGKTQWRVMSTFWHKMSDLKPVCSIKMWKLTEKSHFWALSVMFLRLVCILKLEGLLKAMLSGKTQWRVMSTFWHKMSDLKPVCSIKMWKLTEKSHFWALSVMFLRLVCILKLEGLLQAMLSGKTQWRVMSTFWHKMSDLKPVCSIKMWKLTEKSHFWALSVMFLRLVCILKLEGLLQAMLSGKTQWRVMSTFWHKMSDLKPVCSIKMWKLTEKSHFWALSVMFLRLVCILKLEGLLQAMLSGKTQWRVMSTFWHKMSDLKPVCSIKMWKLTEKSHFWALSVMFLRLVCILKLEGLLQAMLSGKTQWRVMSTFWHKMSDLKPVCSIKMWKLTEKSHFWALSVMFLRLVCILKLEGLLQCYVKWKNTMTCNVNFLTQNVGPWTCCKQFIWWYWPKNHIFVPSPLCFWG